MAVNGEPVTEGVRPGSYVPIRRLWKAGDKVRLELDMKPQLMMANSRVEENVGRVAVARGPLGYCLEKIDQPQVGSLANVALIAGQGSGFKSEFQRDLLGGIVLLQHQGEEIEGSGEVEPLYRPVGARTDTAQKPVTLTFIPYYAWANRTASAMRVWIPYERR